MTLTLQERQLIAARSLIAVCDESGHRSSVPGEESGDDFAIAAVIFQGRRAFLDIKKLDEKLQILTGRVDYKYRQVRQSTEARTAVIETLNRQSGLIRIHGFYAGGGAFIREAERSLNAVTTMNSGDLAVQNAKEHLSAMRESPGRMGLRGAIINSLPSLAHWATSRRQAMAVYFDQRSDMPEFSRYLNSHVSAYLGSPVLAPIASHLQWKAECIPELCAVARVADIFAGDIRHTFRNHGDGIWGHLENDGFVGRHSELLNRKQDDVAFPMVVVGNVSNAQWDANVLEGSTGTTMFKAYGKYLIKRTISLFSPGGIGCHIRQVKDRWDVIQNPD